MYPRDSRNSARYVSGLNVTSGYSVRKKSRRLGILMERNNRPDPVTMGNETANYVSERDVTEFNNAGATVLRGLFSEWIPQLREGAERNFRDPGPRAISHRKLAGTGRFLEDFCNWDRIPEYRDFLTGSPIADVAATIMNSRTVQFFHDHYLHKEANADVATPWHQDMPYYCLEGNQTVSFWIPLNPVPIEYSLKCVAGSHNWPKLIRPTSWSSEESFYDDNSSFMDLPDLDGGQQRILVWEIEPGDAVAFNFKTVHGANANTTAARKRTLSFRLLGDDVRYLGRPGRTSPDFPGIGQEDGERLRKDWFPLLR